MAISASLKLTTTIGGHYCCTDIAFASACNSGQAFSTQLSLVTTRWSRNTR